MALLECPPQKTNSRLTQTTKAGRSIQEAATKDGTDMATASAKEAEAHPVKLLPWLKYINEEVSSGVGVPSRNVSLEESSQHLLFEFWVASAL